MDRDEFTTFYAAAFHRLVGQLYAMTGDQAEAQDAVQEAFVRAWARRGRLDKDGSPEGWIRVTAWRIAVSKWRRTRDGSRLPFTKCGHFGGVGSGAFVALHKGRKFTSQCALALTSV